MFTLLGLVAKPQASRGKCRKRVEEGVPARAEERVRDTFQACGFPRRRREDCIAYVVRGDFLRDEDLWPAAAMVWGWGTLGFGLREELGAEDG